MNILKKRIIACMIDAIVYGGFYTVCIDLVSRFSVLNIKLFYVLFLLSFCCRDMLFRNASLGKKIMGIAVFDRRWQRPKFPVLFIRSAGTTVIGYIKGMRILLVRGQWIDLFDWERDTFGTFVIDQKLLSKFMVDLNRRGISEEHKAEELTALYNEFLREIYMR